MAAGEGGGDLVLVVTMEACCTGQAWPEAERALVDELTSSGMRPENVLGIATTEEEQQAELGALARERGATAAMRVIRSARHGTGAVAMWVTDHDTGSSVERQIELPVWELPEAETVIAVRAVETLRASLTELRLDEPPPEEPEPEPAEEELPEAQDPPPEPGWDGGEVLIGAHGLLAGTTDSVGLRGGLGVALSWLPVKNMIVALTGRAGLFGADAESAAGSASLDYSTIAGWVLLRLEVNEWLFPALGVGGGGAVAWTSGRSDGDAPPARDRTSVAYLGAMARLAVALGDRVRLVACFSFGELLPEVEIYRGDERLARFGQPILEGGLGIDVVLH